MTTGGSGRRVAGAQDRGGKASSLVVLLTAALCLLAGAGYFVLQAHLPAAGAVVIPNVAAAWQSDGVAVDVLAGEQSEESGAERLVDGDVVVAIDDQPLNGWAPRIAWGRSVITWQHGDVVPLTVRRDGREITVSARLGPYPLLAAVSGTWSIVVFAFSTFLVGTFVLWRRPQLPAARVLFLWGTALLSAMTWALGLDIVQLMSSQVFWLYTATACAAYLLFWTCGLHLSLIFPSAHPWLRGREGLAWLVHPLAGLVTIIIASRRLMAGESLAWLSAFLRSVDLVSLPTGALMIGVLVWGYRRYYDEDGRRRARIFLFAAIVCGGLGIILWNLAPLIIGRPLISSNVAGLLLVPAPLALAVAIVRQRLFDIDVVIRRTLIYSVLTAALALIYLGSVVVLQAISGAFSGGFSNFAIMLSTLAIAMLFSPLRQWIQTSIDRRFYRSKYDARATVARFAEATRDEVDLDALNRELVELIRQTVQPSFVALWLVEKGD